MQSNRLSQYGLCLTAVAITVLAVACVKTGDAAPELPFVNEATPQPDRADCSEIQGTAFRSTAERTWYQENCNRWPLVGVPQTAAAPARPEPPECAARRGRPYQSEEQRQWYLRNCLSSPSPAATAQPAGTPQPGDRTDCNAIRGTPYRSNAERDWFLRNCPSTPSGGAGPDRTDCNQIRGTSYRSATERDWFQNNCQAATGMAPTPRVIVASPGNRNNSQDEPPRGR